jgi:hypothetical protein
MPHMCRMSCQPMQTSVNGGNRARRRVLSLALQAQEPAFINLQPPSHKTSTHTRSHDSHTTSSVHYLHIIILHKTNPPPRSARLIKIIMRPVPMCRRPTQACNSGASASSKIASMLLDVRGAHPIQHSEDEQVQCQAIHRKQVPARPRLQHEPRDLENSALGQAHALQCSCTFSPAESGEWRDVAFVRAAIAVQGQA